MASSQKQLIGLQRAEFDKAARLQVWSLRTQIAIAVVAVLTAIITNSIFTYIAAILAVVLAIAWIWLQGNYSESRAQAERARRATLLMDGLGEALSGAELRDLESRFTVSTEEGAAKEDRTYYAARATPGDERLIEMLEESAFWSADLMRHSAGRSWLYFSTYILIGTTLLFLAVPALDGQNLQTTIRAVCAIILLFFSTDVLGAALAYGRSAATLQTLMPKFESIKVGGYRKADLLMLLFDYNSGVESAPMIPQQIYDARRDELNRLWNKRAGAAKK